MMLEHIAQIKVCCLFRRNIGCGGAEMCHLGEAVDTHQNSIESVRLWQLDNEIHRHGGPRRWRDW